MLFSCETKRKDGKVHIVATTGIIADVLRSSLDSSVSVDALMGPGVDPHLYKATARDITTLLQADIIVCNGLHLEGKMSEILKKVGKTKTVLSMSDYIPEQQLLVVNNGVHDPHCWFNVSIWNKALQGVLKAIADKYPAIIEQSKQQSEKYRIQLDSLHEFAKRSIAGIPQKKRFLITAHDAFGYFGKAYGISVVGLQGISTLSEYGVQDVNRISSLIVKNQIPAIFVETSLSPRSMEALLINVKAMNGQVAIGGNLYTDALGASHERAGTYIGMIQHNVKTIIQSLR